MSAPAVFLDRDGTIIFDSHYPRDPETVRLLPGSAEALRKMREKGYLLFVVSNQSGISRGLISDEQFFGVHTRVCELLQAEGVEIAEFSYCLHHPDDNCGCRKPAPGLVPRKYQGQDLDLEKSFMVGDKDCDLQLSDAIGAQGYLVLTGRGQETFDAMQSEGGVEERYRVRPDLLAVAADLPPA